MLERYFFEYTFNKSQINERSDTLQKIFMIIYQVVRIIHFFLTVHELKVHKGFIKGFMTAHILETSHSIFIFFYEIGTNRSHGDVVPV